MQDLEQLNKEAQELRKSNRKLLAEIEEKNEIISVLKEELETSKEQNDHFEKELRQLNLDLKKFQNLQDEYDEIKAKELEAEKLYSEIDRLKEKLNELDFFKLRVQELEDDRRQAQLESAQFEEKCKLTETKLTHVNELEKELTKLRSFNQDLELERDSLQDKLLKSIEQETRLAHINKQAQEEVKRLRFVVKSYEEKRDEEEASNSLIMSVADLKLINQAQTKHHQEQQKTNHHDQSHDEESNLHSTSNSHKHDEISDIINQQQETLDTSIKYELDKQLEKELKQENSSLKLLIGEQEAKIENLATSNEQVKTQLEANKILISDLRQDLACEKNLALKLSNRLASFEKQIKHLDNNYLPIHDTSTDINKNPRNSPLEANKCKENYSSQLDSDVTPLVSNLNANRNKSQPKIHTSDAINNEQKFEPKFVKAAPPSISPRPSASVVHKQAETITSPNDIINESISGLSKPSVNNKVITLSDDAISSGTSDEESETQEPSEELNNKSQSSTANDATIPEGSNQKLNGSDVAKEPNHKDDFADEEDDEPEARQPRAPTPVKTRSSTSMKSNFVRNSMPSRSVNYGHSRTYLHLDRVRASVQANTSSFTSSGNKLAHVEGPKNVLNGIQQGSQLAANGDTALQSSRQVNALIDPFNHEQMMMLNIANQQRGTLNDQFKANLAANMLASPANIGHSNRPSQLTEQQLAHIQQQHYYHHLQHMHQLHQLHHHQLHLHLHHHHRMQKERNYQDNQKTPHPSHGLKGPLYSGGSQFYAPTADQLYANTSTSSPMNKPRIEVNSQMMPPTDLKHSQTEVGSDNSSRYSGNQCQVPPQTRHPPQQSAFKQPLYVSPSAGQYGLPLIAEVNGLPSVDSRNNSTIPPMSEPRSCKANGIRSKGDFNVRMTSHHPTSNHNQSPATSSSCSSTSPLSHSSEDSPSSSLSSLSGTNTRIPSQSCAIDSMQDDHSKRHYGSENDLIDSGPMSSNFLRVGSCRAPGQVNDLQPSALIASRGMQGLSTLQSQLPNPRPSMASDLNRSILAQSSLKNQTESRRSSVDHRLSAERDTIDRTAERLNNMRFNDNLAYSSLRAPKNSSFNMLAVQSGPRREAKEGILGNTKRAHSSTPEKRLHKANDSANKSAVLFEYGCV